MAIKAEARIVLRGGSEAIKSLQGVTRATAQQRKEESAAAKETTRWHRLAMASMNERLRREQSSSREASRLAVQTARAKESADKQAVRSAEQSAKQIERAQEQLANRYARLAQRSADERIKQEHRATLAAQREAAEQARIAERTAATQQKARRDAFRKTGGIVAGTVVGTAVGATYGALQANSTARGIAGAKDLPTRIIEGNDFSMRMAATSSAAGLSKEERAVAQANIIAASTKNGSDVSDLLGVIEEGQAQFSSSLGFFIKNIEQIDTVATSARASTKDLAVALGQMKTQFNLTDEQTLEAAYRMKASADIGAIELKDLASAMSGSIGVFASGTGLKGMEAVQQFLAVAQTTKTGGFDASQTATQVERFSADLQDKDVRKGLSSIGIKESSYTSEHGAVVDVGRLLDRLATNKKFQNQGTRQGIFKEDLSLRAVNTMLARREDLKTDTTGKAFDFTTMKSQADVVTGQESVKRSYAAISEEDSFSYARENAKMQAETIKHLKSYNEQTIAVLKAGNGLETSFGRLALWADSIASTGIGGVVGGLAQSAGGTFLGNLGSKALNAGSLASGAATAGRALLGGPLGLLIGALTAVNYGTKALNKDGKTAFEIGSEHLLSMAPKWPGWDGGEQQPTVGASGNGDLVAAVREGNRIQQQVSRQLESVGSGLRAQAEKPREGGPREAP